jgi:hypothetical protein
MTKDYYKPKTTQGQEKLFLYIQKLIRNEVFLNNLKKLESSRESEPTGNYDTWTEEQKKEHDYLNKEIGSIIRDYKKLQRRCEKLRDAKIWKIQENLNYEYGLDMQLLSYISCLIKKDSVASFYEDYVEMCRVENQYDEEIMELNPGDSFIHLRGDKISKMMAYPVSINIHSMASKRDVLDFIEKRWKWIDSQLRQSEERVLKIKRKKKYSQDILDFIWKNKEYPATTVKNKLDQKFPNNGLIYYEINKIIQIEKNKRLKKIT